MSQIFETQGNIAIIPPTSVLVRLTYTAPYSTTKNAVLSLTKSLAMEQINSPVRINALAPGGMTTEMGLGIKFPENADKSLILRYCGFRPPSTPEIGRASCRERVCQHV